METCYQLKYLSVKTFPVSGCFLPASQSVLLHSLTQSDPFVLNCYGRASPTGPSNILLLLEKLGSIPCNPCILFPSYVIATSDNYNCIVTMLQGIQSVVNHLFEPVPSSLALGTFLLILGHYANLSWRHILNTNLILPIQSTNCERALLRSYAPGVREQKLDMQNQTYLLNGSLYGYSVIRESIRLLRFRVVAVL